jgi:hypothetical protein
MSAQQLANAIQDMAPDEESAGTATLGALFKDVGDEGFRSGAVSGPAITAEARSSRRRRR